MINLKTKLKNQKVAIIVGSVVIVLLVIGGSGAGYAYAFQGKFFPGVSVGTIPLGGSLEFDGRNTINDRVDELFLDGVEVSVNGSTKTIPLRVEAENDPDLSRDLVILNVDDALSEGYSIGRRGSFFQRVYEITFALIARPNVEIKVDTDQEVIGEQLLEHFGEYYDPAVEPTFMIEKVEDLWEIGAVDGHSGRAFDLDQASTRLIESLSSLSMKPLNIKVVDQKPELTIEDVNSMIDSARAALETAPYTLAYDGGRFDQYEFELTDDELAPMLAIRGEKDKLVLTLNSSVDVLMDEIKAVIDTEARDAKFKINNTRVNEFQPSINGRTVNTEETLARLEVLMADNAVDDEGKLVPLDIAVDIVEPAITTGSVNDLGIAEILGVGQSDFAGSPSNRIKNIQHGMSKLEGTLIAPGEEFSLLAALRPFTIADGYLPELVIKGDEIKAEVAGGLCQIGSTTFRAVMNSGLEVTQRRNHSLVVSYYDDLSNGNPGTDATIYDPAPDFRFRNNTEHYILFTTDMDMTTKLLSFTFWGTSDGRKGYYTPPVVQNWIGAGPTRTTYTTELAPGVRRCQGSHPGANTSFTYFVERPDGELESTVYESHYRALPTICLVGLAAGESVDEDGGLVEAPIIPELPPTDPVTDPPAGTPVTP